MSILSQLKNTSPRRFIDFTRGFVPPDFSIARASPVLAFSKNNKLETVAANIPAFGYRDGECLGLQIGAATTNLCRIAVPPPNPKRIGGIFHEWGYNDGLSVAQSTVSAPDGSMNAILISRSAEFPGGNYKYLRYYYPASIGDDVVRTYSFYAKAGSSNNVDAILANDELANIRVRAYFNLTGEGSVNGFEGNNSSYITNGTAGIDYVGNGWYRCWLTVKFLSTANYTRLPNLLVYPGIRSAQNEGDSINFWGAQHEASYRPNPLNITNGAEVSTVGDAISSIDSFGYGTMLATVYNPSAPFDTSEASLVAFGNTNDQARIATGFAVGGTTKVVRARLRRGGVDIVHTQTTVVPDKKITMAASFSSTGVNVAYGGTSATAAYQDNNPATFSGMKVGQWVDIPAVTLSGYIQRIAIFDQTMTVAELVALTKVYRQR